MKRTIAALLAAALLLGRCPAAAGSAGADPFNFLFLDANARAAGLGGAYTALAGDANALLYNPAGLAKPQEYQATFMHNELFEGISQEYLGFAARQGWGLSVNSLSFGRVQRTTISRPEGSGLGSTGLSDLAVTGGYARSFGEALHVGGGLKLLREQIDGTAAAGAAVDLGAMVEVLDLPDLTLGLALQNMGPNVKFERATERLPFNLRAGAAYGFVAGHKASVVSLDLSKERSRGPVFAVGAETLLLPAMALRVGFTTRGDAGPGVTAGIGWVHALGGLDYAFVPYGELGYAHRFSLTARWGGDPESSRKKEVLPELREDARAGPKPKTAKRHLADAEDFVGLGLLEEALASLRSAESLLKPDDPLGARINERLGYIAYREDRVADAKAFYTEAIKAAIELGVRGKPVADAYAGAGLCFAKEGEYERAGEFFEKALRIGPSGELRALIAAEQAEMRRRKM